jgi:hypothetical protein
MSEAFRTPVGDTYRRPGLGTFRALLAVVRRDAYIAGSYRAMYVTQPIGVLFTLGLFYFVSRLLGSSARLATPDEYFAFVAVGVVIQSLVRASLGVPLPVRQELIGGTYERFELSAAGGTLGVVGMLVYPAVRAGAGRVYVGGFRGPLRPRRAVVDRGLVVAARGAQWAGVRPCRAVVLSVHAGLQTSARASVRRGGVSPISGLYFPVELLPGWIEWTSAVQPFTPAVDLMRYVLVGTELPQPLWLELLRRVAFVVIGVPAAARTVSVARRFGRRRGTLLES